MNLRFNGLWRHADFTRLWAAQTISKFGSQIGAGAVGLAAILLLEATPTEMGLLAAAAALPALIFGLPAGVWVDRMRRRPILIATDLGRALLLAIVPVAALLGALRMELLYLVVAAVGALTIFFDVAYQSYLPSLVGRRELVEGNSKLGMSDSVAEIVGPPLGGLLVQLVSAPLAIAIDALSYLGSALFLWRIHAPEPAGDPGAAAARAAVGVVAPQPGRASQMFAEIREGLLAAVGNPVLRTLLGSSVILGLAGGIIGSLYSLYAIRELGMSPALLGLTIGVGGVGALFGAFIAAPLTRRLGIGRTMAASALVMCAMATLIPLAYGPWAVALLMLSQVGDVAWSVFFVNEVSLRQAVTPERLLGRVSASTQFLGAGAAPLGALLGGLLGEAFGIRTALALGVAGLVCAGAWVIASPIRPMGALPGEAATASAAGAPGSGATRPLDHGTGASPFQG